MNETYSFVSPTLLLPHTETLRQIEACTSGPRRETTRVVKRARQIMNSKRNEHTLHHTAKNELDTRADTICAGANWRLLNTTGQCCDVSGFHDDFEPIKDVPVARAATGWKDDYGVTYILIANEVLFFGNEMDHSLINPNQIRHYGVPVSDNPYDETKDLGIDHDVAFIPFHTEGSTVYFDTFVPTDDELETCQHLIISDGDTEWDPHNIEMTYNRPYGDNANRAEARMIKTVQRERQKQPFEFESDLVLGSISSSLVPNLSYERMVSSVRISKTSSKQTKVRPKSASKVIGNSRHSTITPEHLARMHGIGLDKAKQLIRVTTQKGIRTAKHPIHRRYRVDHLDLHSNRLKGKWYVDWMPSKTRSITQCTGSFVYTNGEFTQVYPKESNTAEYANMSLNEFCADVGIPEKLKSDRAPELCGRQSAFLHNAKKKGIDLTYAEPERKNQIHKVDLEIRELKKRWHHKKKTKQIPERVWDFGIKHSAEIQQILPRNSLNGRTGLEAVTGKTPDISEYCDFDIWDLIWYFPGVHPSISQDNRKLGRWLGVSHRIGSDMCYWIMTVDGTPIAETTVQHVTRDDLLDDNIKSEVDRFTETLNTRLNDDNFRLPGIDGYMLEDVDDEFDLPQWDPAYGNNTPGDNEYGDMMTEPLADAEDDIDPEVYDKYIGAKVVLDEGTNSGGNLATVKRRTTDINGRPTGTAHSNPLLDTREYEIELEDGTTDRIFANKIAENIYAQVDDEGREILAFSDIIGHRRDDTAVSKEDGFTELGNGHRKCEPTTKGWQILIQWRDETTTWVDLKDVKSANPIELAEYAIASQIDDEPAFAWWVPYTIKKRNRIINKAKTKYWRTTHKYGVRVPTSVEEALQIDRETGTDYWEKAINKEMKKAKVAYSEVNECTPEDVRSGNVPSLNGFQEISCHIIFDVKMDFTRKARFVAGGHTTETPVGLCYSSVVSRESVRIAFLVAALNDLDVFACDIGNAYLNAPCREKIWFVMGPECGREMKGRVAKLVRALYGLKSSGASWRKMFKDFIETKMGFKPCLCDSDMYYRRNKTSDGRTYYELLLVYVDDVLALSHDPGGIMKQIGTSFEIKNDEYGPPTQYLGADVEQFTLRDGSKAWSLLSTSYVKNAIETVTRLLAEDGRELKSGARPHKGPLPQGYKPELDTTEECSIEHMSRYQQLIGILRWAVELGRIDIQVEIAIMSQYQASPREGHLEALYLIFHYLARNPKKRLVMDPNLPLIDESAFNTDADWKEFYGDVIEEDPPRMPEPLGKALMQTLFVDADHASNVVTRRSHTGVFHFLNNAMIESFSKRQNTVESSTFGSELVAMRIARDLAVKTRLKLKSIGVPLMGPANIYCDNQGVVKNTSIPESTLSKKHNAINYHVVREAAAAGILRVAKEDTETNLADALTKLLSYTRKAGLLGQILYDY